MPRAAPPSLSSISATPANDSSGFEQPANHSRSPKDVARSSAKSEMPWHQRPQGSSISHVHGCTGGGASGPTTAVRRIGDISMYCSSVTPICDVEQNSHFTCLRDKCGFSSRGPCKLQPGALQGSSAQVQAGPRLVGKKPAWRSWRAEQEDSGK